MGSRHSPKRAVIILALLCISLILTAGCVSDYVIRKNVVVFRMNGSGAQQSAVSFLIEKPRYDSYSSLPQAGRTCDGGLLLLNNYFTINTRDTGTPVDDEYRHWFRVERIDPDGRVAWEEIRQANRSYPRITSIREYPGSFVFTSDTGETVTLDKASHPGSARSPTSCPEQIYPEVEEPDAHPTGTPIPATVPNGSRSFLQVFPPAYVSLTDLSTPDWNGYEKLGWDLVRFTGISDVRDEGFTLDVKIFNRTGFQQGTGVLRWQPATAAERIGNCQYTMRSFPAVYPAEDEGYFVVADLRCFG